MPTLNFIGADPSNSFILIINMKKISFLYIKRSSLVPTIEKPDRFSKFFWNSNGYLATIQKLDQDWIFEIQTSPILGCSLCMKKYPDFQSQSTFDLKSQKIWVVTSLSFRQFLPCFILKVHGADSTNWKFQIKVIVKWELC